MWDVVYTILGFKNGLLLPGEPSTDKDLLHANIVGQAYVDADVCDSFAIITDLQQPI